MDRARKSLRSRRPLHTPVEVFSERIRRRLATPVFEAGLPAVLVRLDEFAEEVRRGDFETRVAALLKKSRTKIETTQLLLRLAESLASKLPKGKSAIVMKSLQETLFVAAGLETQLPHAILAAKLQDSLRARGSKGWIAIFLQFHSENALRLRLEGERSLQEMNPAIEALAKNAVRTSIRSLKKWPQVTLDRAETLLASLQSSIVANPLRLR